jgi:hypothetical protein
MRGSSTAACGEARRRAGERAYATACRD